MIEVETPDGIFEFPDETDEATIKSALDSHFGRTQQTAAPNKESDWLGLQELAATLPPRTFQDPNADAAGSAARRNFMVGVSGQPDAPVDVVSRARTTLADTAALAGTRLQQGFHDLGEQGNSLMQLGSEPFLKLGPLSLTPSGLRLSGQTEDQARIFREGALGAREQALALEPQAQELEQTGIPLVGDVTRGATSMIPAIAAGPLGVGGVVAASGLQQGASTLSNAQDAYEKRGVETDKDSPIMPNRAFWKAAGPAAIDAAQTAAITFVAGKLFGQGAEGLTMPGKRAAVSDLVKQSLGEAVEEGTQQLISDAVIAKMSYNPEMTFAEAFKSAKKAALIGGLLGGGVTLARSGLDTLLENEAEKAEKQSTPSSPVSDFFKKFIVEPPQTQPPVSAAEMVADDQPQTPGTIAIEPSPEAKAGTPLAAKPTPQGVGERMPPAGPVEIAKPATVPVTPEPVTADTILSQPLGSTSPEAIIALPRAEYEKLTSAKDTTGTSRFSLSADAAEWAMKQTSTPELIARLKELKAGEVVKLSEDNPLDRSQWFSDAIHVLEKDEVGRWLMNDIARRKGNAPVEPPATPTTLELTPQELRRLREGKLPIPAAALDKVGVPPPSGWTLKDGNWVPPEAAKPKSLDFGPIYYGDVHGKVTGDIPRSKYGDYGSAVYVTPDKSFAESFASGLAFSSKPKGSGKTHEVEIEPPKNIFRNDETPLTKEEISFWSNEGEGISDATTRDELIDAVGGRNFSQEDLQGISESWDAFLDKFGYDAVFDGSQLAIRSGKVKVKSPAPQAPTADVETKSGLPVLVTQSGKIYPGKSHADALEVARKDNEAGKLSDEDYVDVFDAANNDSQRQFQLSNGDVVNRTVMGETSGLGGKVQSDQLEAAGLLLPMDKFKPAKPTPDLTRSGEKGEGGWVKGIESEAKAIADAIADRKAKAVQYYQYDFQVDALKELGLPETAIENPNWSKLWNDPESKANRIRNSAGFGFLNIGIKPEVIADAVKTGDFSKLPTVEQAKSLADKKQPTPPPTGEAGAIARQPQGGQGRAADPSSRRSQSILTAEQRETATQEAGEPVAQPFILSERVQQVLNKIGVPSAERYLPKRLLGLFKHRGENIRVKALADAFVASHEATHFISRTFGIGSKVIADTPRGHRLRKQLTDIYTEFYPGAKRSHKLERRVEEGLAVLMENYAYQPTAISEKYPELVNTFIKNDGKYYHPKFTELLDGIGQIVGDYAKLTPEQQVGTRIVRGDEINERDTGFDTAQRMVFELFNAAEPLVRWAKKAGVSETVADPTVWYYSWLDRGTHIANWIMDDNTTRFSPEGNIISEPGTIKTYVRLIEGREKEFDSFLVARRVVEDHNRLADLKEKILQQELALEQAEGDPEASKEAAEELKRLNDSASRLESVLNNDNFDLSTSTAVVGEYADTFKKAVAVYDSLNERLVKVARDSGLISNEYADELLSQKGYASFLRHVNDNLMDEGNPYSQSSQSKAKIFKARHGGELNIISPVFNQKTAISEVLAKAAQNRVWQKALELGNNNPEIARRFEVIETVRVPEKDGSISYPQDKDPNLLKVWRNGQRVFIKPAPEFKAVMDFMSPADLGIVADLLTMPSATFTRLTTSANPLFALGNLTVDQFSAWMQTKTGYKPGLEPIRGLKQMFAELSKLTPADQKEMQKFLTAGGRRTTLAASLREATPEKFITGLEKSNTIAGRVGKIIDSGLNVLELPSNLSEFLSRFGEYRRSLEKGEPAIVALYRASEVTTPFKLRGNLGGKAGQIWVRAIPYLNAALQVNYKFARSARDNPARVATVSSVLITTALLTAIAAMKYADDEQKRLLRNLQGGDLGRFLYFPSPLGKRLIRLRIPEAVGALTAPVYLYTQAFYNKDKVKFDTLLDASTQFVPPAFNVTQPKEAVLNLLPVIVRPSIQVAANLKTYPSVAPIVPHYVAENTAPEDQYTAYTSKVAVGMGKMLGVSPAKVEFWVRNQFGAVGGMMLGKLQSFPLTRQESEIAFAGRLYNDFYERREYLRQQNKKIKDGKSKFSVNEQRRIATDLKAHEVMAERLSELRKMKEVPEATRQSVFERLLEMEKD